MKRVLLIAVMLIGAVVLSAGTVPRVEISGDTAGGVVLTPAIVTATPVPVGTPVPAATFVPTFAPTVPPSLESGRTIFYVANIDGPWSVYQMRPDGTGQKRVTKQDLSVNRWSYFSPVPSPDLKSLLLVMQRGVNSWLFLKDLTRDAGRRITKQKDYEFDPVWSSDGKQMAWAGLVQPNGYHIFIASAKGWPPRQVTTGQWPCTHPTFSPDGREICFVSKRDGVESLYAMPIGSEEIRRLTGPALPAFYPTWSPDGKDILFVSVKDKKSQIFKTDSVNGSRLVQVSDGSFNDKDPAWSPDGKSIVFVSDQEGNDELWVMDRDGQGRKRLTFNHAQSRHPSWR
jgi:TolB protein